MPLERPPTRRVFLALAFGSVTAWAGNGPCPLDAQRLADMNPAELEASFRVGTVNGLPVGYGRGRPLLVLDAKNPRRRAALQGVVWKGKHFLPDGRIINQWAVGRAVEATVRIDPSWLDGAPCIHLDYPPGAPIFGNTRDELREVAPGLYLGRFYRRCPCPRFQGYFVVDMACR